MKRGGARSEVSDVRKRGALFVVWEASLLRSADPSHVVVGTAHH